MDFFIFEKKEAITAIEGIWGTKWDSVFGISEANLVVAVNISFLSGSSTNLEVCNYCIWSIYMMLWLLQCELTKFKRPFNDHSYKVVLNRLWRKLLNISILEVWCECLFTDDNLIFCPIKLLFYCTRFLKELCLSLLLIFISNCFGAVFSLLCQYLNCLGYNCF